MNRENFLFELASKYPEIKVHYINQQDKTIWPTEKAISECSEADLKQINLRKLRPNEIILDVEEPHLIDDIRKKIAEFGWSYELWETGSRGFHIVLLFDNLAEHDEKVRNRIRKYIISEFKTDVSLAVENHFLALEHTNHFKSGKEKTLKEEFKSGDNTIDIKIIDYCKEEIELNESGVMTAESDFAEFLTDPYLNYALENMIVDGGRNSILFKNLAIGLVKAGHTDEDILKVAIKIVGNCPGKNVGEFMGWVNKCREGELNDFNKYELNQWAMECGHPPFYKLVGDDIKFEPSIKELWNIIWDNRIVNQPVWRDLVFNNMLGVIVKETSKETDLRVHTIFSCYSTSGKDEGLNLERDILERINEVLVEVGKPPYLLYSPSEITDRTLVGSVNQYAIEYNTKHGLEEGELKANGTKELEGKKETDEGILQDADWIAFGECESVLKPGAHNRKIQLLFRQAMDKRRQIQKGVGGRMIDINTHTSFILTTYPLNEVIYKLLTNGLFQRCLYYHKEMNDKDHQDIRHHTSKMKFNATIKNNFDEKYYIEQLVKKLVKMKLWYDENKNKITYFPKCDNLVNKMWSELESEYGVLNKMDRDILNSIIRRGVSNLWKLIVLGATWKMKTYVDMKDVEECFELIKLCVNSVKDIVLQQDKHEKRLNGALQLLLGGSIATMNFYKQLEVKLNLKSTSTQKKFMEKIRNLGYIEEFKEGYNNMIMLSDKGRKQLDDEE